MKARKRRTRSTRTKGSTMRAYKQISRTTCIEYNEERTPRAMRVTVRGLEKEARCSASTTEHKSSGAALCYTLVTRANKK